MSDLPVVDFYEILEKIKALPAMYMGVKSIHALNAWIAGIRCVSGHMMSFEQPEICILKNEPAFDHFHQWVRAKYDFTSATSGWANMLFAAEAKENPDRSFDRLAAMAVDRFLSRLSRLQKASLRGPTKL